MDVRIGTILPTPRHGKPVEVNAYWYNALQIMARLAPLAGADGAPYAALAAQAGESFRRAFWMPEAALWTPCGLRTLDPADPDFHPVYGGPQKVRDMAYHQGTVWPFPLGGYYLAELRLGGFDEASCARVRQDLDALAPALREGCLGHLPEIYDGGTPGASRGCFAQAWSVGELLRVCEALERPEAAGFAGDWAE